MSYIYAMLLTELINIQIKNVSLSPTGKLPYVSVSIKLEPDL